MLEFTPEGVLRSQLLEVDGGMFVVVFATSLASVGHNSVVKSNGSMYEV